ncbi:MAG: hypothetical protein K5872_22060 [Rhizobiaceae bacterium]|nr:hypothetical protein [Rhizobiaceae bacterium]MCV0408905.1 hypothetical protein [Rhizobiaceae bacterium]
MNARNFPSLADLEHALDVWRGRLVCADHIDSTARRDREKVECRFQIEELEKQIARIRESF